VSVDLVFGFPESNAGYKGLLVCVEQLSKFPVAYPIKSKNKEEIAEKLLDYFSNYGCSSHLISDRGNELCNNLVETMLTNLNIKHVVTSAYFPQANGGTERLNSIIVQVLRKYAEKDEYNWPKYLPYVMMCLRNKIHTVTGKTPFELLFGRKMNFFEKIDNYENCSEIKALELRTDQVKKLIEEQQSTVKTIEKAQLKQMQIQNSNHRICLNPLKPGTSVYIKTEGLHNKLYPKFKGPYEVVNSTKSGNYILKTKQGITLEDSYPLIKLKLVGNESENKNNENLVPKKRGRPPNIKIPITDKLLTNNEITAKQLTNNEITTKREQINENRFHTRPIRSCRINKINYFCNILFILMLAIVSTTSLQLPEENFVYCNINKDISKETVLDIEKMCKIEKGHEPIYNISGKFMY
jgi:hypothetical protein